MTSADLRWVTLGPAGGGAGLIDLRSIASDGGRPGGGDGGDIDRRQR